jgi:hypothetical protein
VGSVIGGGKFANGAETATYGYLFNYCQSIGCVRELQRSIENSLDGFAQKLRADLQVGVQTGPAAGLGIGVSSSVGIAYDTTGRQACVVENCLLIGPFAGAAWETGGQAAIGTISSTGWSVGAFGKFALPPGGGALSLGYGSDGLQLSIGDAMGGIAGGGVKACISKTEASLGGSLCK